MAKFILSFFLAIAIASGCASDAAKVVNSKDTLSVQSGANRLATDAAANSMDCKVGKAPSNGAVALAEVWGNVEFNQPLGLVQLPGANTNDFFILQKTGHIRRVKSDYDSNYAEVFLDLSGVVETDGEGGVWGMAFHPKWPIKPYVYVSYLHKGEKMNTRISRFTTTDGLRADGEKVVFELWQQDGLYGGSMHNGGSLMFGPDGFLYMSVGDDARKNELGENALYGSIIRLDIDQENGYAIPSDNPFGNEIFALGLRNPWRMSFDSLTGELWVGDVGEECREEINRIEKGKNYGWPNWEGGLCGPLNCQGENTLPTYSYHTTGSVCGKVNSVTGGYVYRGAALPNLMGKYIYGDYMTGMVWAYDPVSNTNEDLLVYGRTKGLAAWGESNEGELFYIDIDKNKIYLLEKGARPVISGPPLNLQDTGCFAKKSNKLSPSAELVPYSIAHEGWSDGLEKAHYFALPKGSAFSLNADKNWVLPKGGMVFQHLTLLGENIETRVIVRYENGSYDGFTYQWEGGKSATLVPFEGSSRVLSNGQKWHYPSRSDCFQCHTHQVNHLIGFENRQINIDILNTVSGKKLNQLNLFENLGVISGAVERLKPLPSLSDQEAPLEDRIKAYFHVNCSSCHQGTSLGYPQWDARFTTPYSNMGICDIAPIEPKTGLDGERYIRPGSPEGSTVYWRMLQVGNEKMPPIGHNLVDEEAVKLMHSWIQEMQLGYCPKLQARPCDTPNNVLKNCGFANGLTPWSAYVDKQAKGGGAIIDGALHINIENPGFASWHVQAGYPLGALPAAEYELRFTARADPPRKIEVSIGEVGEDWSTLCFRFIDLDVRPKNFTIDCGMVYDSEGENKVSLSFNLGKTKAGDLVLDDVYLGAKKDISDPQ